MSTNRSDEELAEHRARLEALSVSELERVLERTRTHRDQILKKREAAELCQLLARRRALGIARGTLIGVRLDMRIEQLFDTIRKGNEKPPVNDILRVFDGIAARILSRRLWLFAIGLFTIIPAVASVMLLAGQNKDMIEQNSAEEERGYQEARALYTELLHGTSTQQETVDGELVTATLPAHHRRIRAEAFETLVALEKQRWSEEERDAIPPTRYVDFRGANLKDLALGGRIGLLDSNERSDFSRVWLEGADLRNTQIARSETAGTVFRNANAQGATFSCGASTGADFSGVDATGATFTADYSSGEPLDLEGANFDGAILRDAVFEQVIFTDVSLDGTDFTGATFTDVVNFAGCDFTVAELGPHMDWSICGLHKCILTEAQFAAVQLSPFSYDEPGDKPGTRWIMSDPIKYQEWYKERSALQSEQIKAELDEIRERDARRTEREEE